MSVFTGTVKTVEKKDWKNGIFMYHFTLEGSPIVHSCGTEDPEVEVGESITFKEGNRKVITSTIERVSAAEAANTAPKPAPVAAASPPHQSTSGDIGERIKRQAARRDAVALVTMAMETNLLPYPKTGKAEDKWGRMLDLVNETMNDLIEQEEDKWKPSQ